jgi:hypothetical protein
VTPDDGRFAHQVSALAGMTSCWISYAAPAQLQAAAASGVAAPDGTWVTRAAADGLPGVALVDLDCDRDQHVRAWRRTARARSATGT